MLINHFRRRILPCATFALLAVLVVFCGCNSRSDKPTQAAGDHETLANPVVNADTPPDAAHEGGDSDEADLRQVQTLTKQGQLATAVELCGNFIGTHPKSAEAFRLRALANAMRHNDADAVADFSTAIILEPKNAPYRIARGMFQLTHGNTTKAIEDFDAALQLNPKNAQALNDRGMARVTSGDLKHAPSKISTRRSSSIPSTSAATPTAVSPSPSSTAARTR